MGTRTDVGINVMPRMQQPPLIASGDYAGFRENHGNLHSLIQPKNALKGKTVFFGPSVLMILIQSPLINKELVYTVVFLHPSQLKYTSANMAMVCSILLSMMPLKPHGFRIFPWLAPGGGAMGTVALCVAMGVIYGGSWKQSQAGLQFMAGVDPTDFSWSI